MWEKKKSTLLEYILHQQQVTGQRSSSNLKEKTKRNCISKNKVIKEIAGYLKREVFPFFIQKVYRKNLIKYCCRFIQELIRFFIVTLKI